MKNLTNIYKKYKGLWVAFDENIKKVITSDPSAKKAYDTAVKMGNPKPTLFKVPKQNLARPGLSCVKYSYEPTTFGV